MLSIQRQVSQDINGLWLFSVTPLARNLFIRIHIFYGVWDERARRSPDDKWSTVGPLDIRKIKLAKAPWAFKVIIKGGEGIEERKRRRKERKREGRAINHLTTRHTQWLRNKMRKHKLFHFTPSIRVGPYSSSGTQYYSLILNNRYNHKRHLRRSSKTWYVQCLT